MPLLVAHRPGSNLRKGYQGCFIAPIKTRGRILLRAQIHIDRTIAANRSSNQVQWNLEGMALMYKGGDAALTANLVHQHSAGSSSIRVL